jgi:hypothetical protein
MDNVVANHRVLYNTFLTFEEAKRWLAPDDI